MSVACRVLFAGSLAALQAGSALAAPQTQYVLISFDGAHDVAQWERSRALAVKTGAKFTYFLSCVYLLSPATKSEYRAPGHAAGRSNVGFAVSKEDVAARLGEIWKARAEGHEIANHACGHFDGAKWSKADWQTEFDEFTSIVRDAWATNGIEGEPAGWKAFVETGITGFRAPYLATADALYEALSENGFAYDASGVSRGPVMPVQGEDVMRFALPQIPEGPSERRVIAMDYNLFVRHSGGIESTDTDQAYENRAYDAFLDAFRKQYRGERIPLQIGFHFSLMNGGAYWRALERFAEEVCVKPGVMCMSYRGYMDRTAGERIPDTASTGG
ncbi:MAG TPA: polysaccharide deacetylase [Rhizobiaceae bacterium]|nr:polysaccharide deacetylase [Rhizobiaceae bacterium]